MLQEMSARRAIFDCLQRRGLHLCVLRSSALLIGITPFSGHVVEFPSRFASNQAMRTRNRRKYRLTKRLNFFRFFSALGLDKSL